MLQLRRFFKKRRNGSEAVKKLGTAKVRRHKSLITKGGILCFGAYRQFFHSFSVTADYNVIGVRPSSGAVMSERERALMESDASEQPVIAAPEDGRTPITL